MRERDGKLTASRSNIEDTKARESVESRAASGVLDAEPIEVSEEERAMLMLDESLANALPNTPKVPGWHFLWASTTNQQNPIQWYLRLGYKPVKREEFPEYGHLKEHSGEFAAFITCNEMVMLKCTEAAYQQIMKEMHHDRPNREAERLLANVDNIKNSTVDSKGRALVTEEGDGYAQVRQERTARVKTFEG